MSQERRAKNLKIEELPASEQDLTAEEAQAARGGLLPYVEQDNVVKPVQPKDGTSNTHMDVRATMMGGSARF